MTHMARKDLQMPSHAESRVADFIYFPSPRIQPCAALLCGCGRLPGRDRSHLASTVDLRGHGLRGSADPACGFRYDIAHASVIVTRDQNSELRAFHNTCRHRGSRICAAERGSSRTFTCPYHQWTYAATGDLTRARHGRRVRQEQLIACASSYPRGGGLCLHLSV